MQITFEQIFKHSDILNPISPTTLLLAGKLAEMNQSKTLLDLGSGKGYPSLLWASTFGVRVKGFDFNQAFVDYANSRARLLNLSAKAEYVLQDLKSLETASNYDVVVSLGIDLISIYGDKTKALKCFKSTLKSEGVLVIAEPVWLKKPVPASVLKALRIKEADFLTISQMKQLVKRLGFDEIGFFLSSKEDWELYIRPLHLSLQEIVAEKPELAEEAQVFIDGFEAEYDAAGSCWNMALWVLKKQKL